MKISIFFGSCGWMGFFVILLGTTALADACGRDMSLEKLSQNLTNLEMAFCVGVKRLNAGNFR
ncbi:hypothetical protein [Endozoicomonas sp.]|uniref:hypothetical protein n=1 Tax=Endozoicomonas sp. TaxID=1892382 RepID=UPI003AF637E8